MTIDSVTQDKRVVYTYTTHTTELKGCETSRTLMHLIEVYIKSCEIKMNCKKIRSFIDKTHTMDVCAPIDTISRSKS